jgi:hypothetical protein
MSSKIDSSKSSVVDAELSESDKTHPIEKAIKIYIEHVDSLFKTLFLTMLTIDRTRNKAIELIEDFEKRNCEISEKDENGFFTVIVQENYQRRWVKLQQELGQISLSRKLIPASFLVSLISQYDAFLGQLIKSLFDVKPELLNSSERNLSYSQLVEFDSIGSARSYILEKEIETVLRKSHSEQFDWLEAKFGIPLRKDLSIWPLFIEVTERRNLFVHTRGLVSSQYIKVCRQHNANIPSDIKVGDELDAPADYMANAYECIFDLGIRLSHVLWRKVDPANRVKADDNLNDICYELLQDKKYKLAIKVLDFSLNTIKKFSSDQIRRMLVINRSLAYKWSGDEKMSLNIIKAEDWTASSDDFKLAEAIILEKYEDADLLTKKIGANSSIKARNYREWPLFLKYSERKEFKMIFKELFNEDFDESEEPAREVVETISASSELGNDVKSDSV